MSANAADAHAVLKAKERVLAHLDDVEQLVDASEWAKTEAALARLPHLVQLIPVAERRDVLLSARERIERLRERVTQQSHETGTRLAAIKTGRAASESYRRTGALSAIR